MNTGSVRIDSCIILKLIVSFIGSAEKFNSIDLQIIFEFYFSRLLHVIRAETQNNLQKNLIESEPFIENFLIRKYS